MFFITQTWERTVDEDEVDRCEGCWVFADLIQQAMCESSVLSLLLFPVWPDFLSYILCPSLNFCFFFPFPLLSTSSFPSNFYRSFYHTSVFSFFTVALNLSFLPLSFTFSSIHPHSSLLFLSPYFVCFLLFPLPLLPLPAGPWGMSHSQRINVKESAHKEHVHSSQVEGQNTQFWGLSELRLFNLQRSGCY